VPSRCMSGRVSVTCGDAGGWASRCSRCGIRGRRWVLVLKLRGPCAGQNGRRIGPGFGGAAWGGGVPGGGARCRVTGCRPPGTTGGEAGRRRGRGWRDLVAGAAHGGRSGAATLAKRLGPSGSTGLLPTWPPI
jgi:hypothetical protein